jgi:hypothetical protein
MTQAHQGVVPVVGPAAPNANVTSTGWPGAGLPQQQSGWCFAAAEQMAQRAFGQNIPQDELAHNAMLARGRALEPGTPTQYYNALRQYLNTFSLPNLDWNTVQAYVTGDQQLFGLLASAWSTPVLRGRTTSNSGAPVEAQIVAAINVGGVVLIGNALHWKVIYGYNSGPTGTVVSYQVYDPYNGGTNTPAMTPTAMANGILHTIYVTA